MLYIKTCQEDIVLRTYHDLATQGFVSIIDFCRRLLEPQWRNEIKMPGKPRRQPKEIRQDFPEAAVKSSVFKFLFQVSVCTIQLLGPCSHPFIRR